MLVFYESTVRKDLILRLVGRKNITTMAVEPNSQYVAPIERGMG